MPRFPREALAVVLFISGCVDVAAPPPWLDAGSPHREELPPGVYSTPNLLLAVDRSGSMALPVGDGGTRLDVLRSGVEQFFGSSIPVLGYGLTLYPTNEFCAAETYSSLQVPLPVNGTPADVLTASSQIVSTLAGTSAIGGTPTGAALSALRHYGRLGRPGARDAVVVITDGAPNCNAENVHDAEDAPSSCRCTLGDQTLASCVDSPGAPFNTSDLSRLGCLDDQGVLAAVSELKQLGIRTFLIHLMPAEAEVPLAVVFNQLSEEGQTELRCDAGTQCGAQNSCDEATGRCQRGYLVASTAEELAEALRFVASRVAR